MQHKTSSTLFDPTKQVACPSAARARDVSHYTTRLQDFTYNPDEGSVHRHIIRDGSLLPCH